MTDLLKYHLTIKWNDALVFDGRMTAVMVKDILDRVCIAQFNGEPALEASRTVPSLQTILRMEGGDTNQLSILCPTGTLYALVTRMHDDVTPAGNLHIRPSNEPNGEGNGWDDCAEEDATAWQVWTGGKEAGECIAAFDTRHEAETFCDPEQRFGAINPKRVTPAGNKCHTCGRTLDDPADPVKSRDCGGDCLACMAEAGDPECIAALNPAHRGNGNRKGSLAP